MYVIHVRNTREVRRGEDEERDEDEGGCNGAARYMELSLERNNDNEEY